MIKAYIGKMRSGKTYAMTKEVMKLLNSGHVVYVNYRVNWDNMEPMGKMRLFLHKTGIWPKVRYPASNLRLFRSWEDVANVAECTVALDEGWQYFDSYNKLPIEKRMRLYQSGKWELDFLYTVQRYMMSDINLRWSTDEFWESTLYKIPFKKYPLILYKLYDLEEDNEGAKIARKGIDEKGNIVDLAVRKHLHFTRKKIFEAYDTKEDIYAEEQVRQRLGQKVTVDSHDRAGYPDPRPTFWADIKSLISGKHEANIKRHRETPQGSAPRRPQPVVARISRRGNADGIRVVRD